MTQTVTHTGVWSGSRGKVLEQMLQHFYYKIDIYPTVISIRG